MVVTELFYALLSQEGGLLSELVRPLLLVQVAEVKSKSYRGKKHENGHSEGGGISFAVCREKSGK